MAYLADYLRANPNKSSIQPLSVTPKPTVANNISPVTTTDHSKLPVNNVNSNDLAQHGELLATQIKNIQDQIAKKQQEYKDQQALEAKNTTQTAEPSIWDKLMSKQQDVQKQTTDLQTGLNNQTNDIYKQFGVTEESLQKITDISTQVGTINAQLQTLDDQYRTDVENARAQTGITQDQSAADVSRITRKYQSDKATLTSKGYLLTAQAQAMQGNYDNALATSKLYVDAATANEKQKVDDLNNGFDLYKDIFSLMHSDEQKAVQQKIDQANLEYKYAQDAKQQEIDNYFKQQGLNIDLMKLTGTGGNGGTGGGVDFGTSTDPSADTRIVDINGKPIKLTATQVDTISGFESALQQISEAKTLAPKVNTGPISGRTSDILRLFNADDPNRISLDAKLNSIKASFLKAISGAAVSESEVKRLTKFLPSINDTEQVLTIKMQELQKAIMTQRNNYLNTIGAKGSSNNNQSNDPLGIR